MNKIRIEIENGEGEVIFRANCLSVGSALAELYRYERHIEPLKKKDGYIEIEPNVYIK